MYDLFSVEEEGGSNITLLVYKDEKNISQNVFECKRNQAAGEALLTNSNPFAGSILPKCYLLFYYF